MAVEMALTRCAVSIFFLRILYTKATPWLRHAAYLCIALSTASVIATLIVQFLHCRRFSLNWEFPLWKHAECFDIKSYLITLVAVSIGVDVITWTTPHHVVWGLQLRRAHKIAITVIFAIGLTTIVIGAIRVASIAKFASGGDLTYSLTNQLLLNLTQMSVGIVVACLPHMRPVFEKIIPRRFTYISGDSSNGKGLTPGKNSISATTTIEVSDTLPYHIWSAPRSYLGFYKDSTHNQRSCSVILDPSHDGQGDSWAPTFEVVQTPVVPRQYQSLHRRQGPPRDWCCRRSERSS
ncbi:hypothetical protein B5807_04800 [Epicoccum nigrum]|uniref:Rhodopsin domain-containing protein n=1 Tax=Epicoccum nigrum TaxID=105696 RepID=A0A1Y2M2N8_EPING|nr:hypothetical protein B5807_04800 [Epicoccum nigrum]